MRQTMSLGNIVLQCSVVTIHGAYIVSVKYYCYYEYYIQHTSTII